MTAIEQGLLADIIANPDDDTPRLVFADWLADGGDHEWAELIRLQLHRDGADWQGMGTVELVDHLEAARGRMIREGLLAAAMESRLKITAMKVLWERGFVASVAASLGEWTEHGPAIAGRHPLKNVWLVDRWPESVRANPWGSDVRYYYARSDAGDSHHLPPAIFDRLGGEAGQEPHTGTTLVAWYRTEDGARLALSRAAIAWARAEWEGRND